MALKSANVTQGVDRAPNRSLFAALGFTKEETDRPLIGIVSSYNEIVPGHMHLDKITASAWLAAPPSCSPPLPSATASPWGTSA